MIEKVSRDENDPRRVDETSYRPTLARRIVMRQEPRVIKLHRPPSGDDSIMSGIQVLGFLAAILTTLCWLPQALKTLRTKDTKSLSLATQSVFAVGVALWLLYGILIGDAPIIFANSVTFILVTLILAMKLRYG